MSAFLLMPLDLVSNIAIVKLTFLISRYPLLLWILSPEFHDEMPRRWFSDRLHDAWGRVAGRRGRQRDQGSQSSQYYAEIVATPDQSPDRASHLHLRRGASLPDLLARAALGRVPPPLPLDNQSLWDTPAPAISPAQSQSNDAIGLGTFLGELEREVSRHDQHFIPTAIITTRNTASIDQGPRGQPWMLPGQDFFPESQPLVPSHLRTGLFSSSQPEHRTLEPCDCCSPKFLFGDWRALTLDPLTHTFTRHESLASSSELRGRDDLNDVFALLLDVLVSPNGLIGQEDELNLPLLLATLSYALDQGMTRETRKLKRTIDRYIPLRMFHHNPHTNSPRLEFEYYEFRSEEVYQAWLVVSHDVPFTGALGDMRENPPRVLVALFTGAGEGSNNSRTPGLEQSNTKLREMSEALDSSSRSDGDDEASSDEESDESSVRETTSEPLRQLVLDALFTGLCEARDRRTGNVN
ncbi:hypothetical protein FNAPI_13996 [Fusarium napiforme]|uniref:Uncharacterized protein n=1 Tax=Fusarium napiforme TaxID=42672 RepID=A0A8H5MH13_9HYPO|nr:hypothetical protein FNAPI_13996 [Fusarium napiforme]